MAEKFGSRTSFIMASVGSAVGLGNLFRFPALAIKYGSVFVIVYIFLLLLLGLPMLMSELALGRKYGGSAVNSIKSARSAFVSVGWLSSANAFVIMTYYCLLFSYVLLAAFFSFKLIGKTSVDAGNIFNSLIYPEGFPVFGCVFLIIGWAAVKLCFGDAERLGKISTIGVIFASAVIGIMAAVGGFSHPQGLVEFLKLSPRHILSADFWLDTLGQVFFSLSVMVGVMPAYGSYLKKQESIAFCAVIIAFFDLLISLAATVIYTCAKAQGSEGLFACFSVYPKAFAQIGERIGGIVAFLFYLSVAVLCLDSVFSYLKSAAAVLSEKLGIAESRASAILSLISAFLGFFLLGSRGRPVVEYLDGEVVPLITLIIGFFEALLFSRLVDSGLLREINLSTRIKVPRNFLRFSLAFLSPAAMIILLFAQIFF